jgi:hypothetical protein
MATADVVIKIDVRDGEAKRKLTALEARLNRLNKAGGQSSRSIGDLGDELDQVTSSTGKFNRELDRNDRSQRKFGRSSSNALKQVRSLSNAFSPLIKFAKYAGIEFGIMAATMVGLKVALVAGQAVAKAWQFTLQALGASAGLAIGALAGVLAAIRELNNAKLKPLALTAGATAGGGKGFGAEISGLTGSGQLGMFKQQTLTGMAKSQYSAGNRVTADYRAMTESLGNFAITADDPDKALSSLTDTFAKAQKEGKFTEEMIKTISESSPHLGKALKETGMNAEQFLAAFSKGEIESLRPFQGALDEVNNTLIGKFKVGLRDTQEQLTQMGAGLTDTATGPLSTFTRQLSIFLSKITPTVRAVMSDLIPEESMTTTQRFFDYLARSINTNLPKIFEWGRSLKEAFSGVGNVFKNMGDWLEKATQGFDNLYENMLKPIGVEIWKTIEHAIMAFSDVMSDTGGYGEKFSETIANIGEGLRGFIDGLAELKKLMAPIISAFMTWIGVVSKLTNVLGPLKALIPLLLLSGLTGRSKVLGPDGKPMKMGMGGGILNTLSMGGYSRAMRGQMPGDKKTRSNFQQKFVDAPRNAGIAARAQQEFAMRSAMALGTTVNGQTGKGLNGVTYTEDQVKRLGGGAASRAQAKEFGKAVVRESKKAFKGPAGQTGLATAGLLAGGLIQGNTQKTNVAGQTIGGIVGGAAMGAMVGTMIPIPGATAVGAVGGAIAGGIGGFLSARSAQREQDKNAMETGKKFARADLDMNDPAAIRARATRLGQLKGVSKESLQADIVSKYGATPTQTKDGVEYVIGQSALIEGKFSEKDINNSLEAINKFRNGLDGFQKTTDPAQIKALNDYEAALVSYQTAMKLFPDDMNKSIEGLTGEIPVLTKQADQASSNIDYLSKWMGKSKDEAKKFADSLGINLSEGMLGLTDVIKMLGYQINEFGDKSIDTANRAQAAGRILDTVMKPIEERQKKAETEEALDAAGMQLFNYTGSDSKAAQKYADEFTVATFEKLTQDYQKSDQSFTDFIADVKSKQKETLGRAEGRMNSVAFEAFKASYSEAITNLTTGASSVQGRMAVDPTYAIKTASKIQEAAKGIQAAGNTEKAITDAAQSLSTTLTADGITVDAEAAKKLLSDEMSSTANKISQAISSTPLTVDGRIQILVGADGKTTVSSATFSGSTTNTRNATLDEISSAVGATVTQQKPADTSTSRLSRTLGKHMAFNTQVAGNRTVTSGLRNWNLGSGMSDHKFGNAYDLTGDNLGQYASLVNGSGGFAEFHGAAGGRHLHVVPPSGDSSTPATTGGMGGTVTNNFNISVQGGPNANANEVARQVVTIIEDRQRSMKERS